MKEYQTDMDEEMKRSCVCVHVCINICHAWRIIAGIRARVQMYVSPTVERKQNKTCTVGKQHFQGTATVLLFPLTKHTLKYILLTGEETSIHLYLINILLSFFAL